MATLTTGRARRHARGVTLAELLVSTAAAGLVLAGAISVLGAGQRLHATGAARVESQQAARVALDRLARDVRGAGRGPGRDFDAVAVAEPQRLTLQQDVDGDGTITAPGERITWRLDGGVLRRDAGAGGQPVVEGVLDLALHYLDGAGEPAADPAAVRSVAVTLTVGPVLADRIHGRGVATTVSTRVRLRNR